MILDGLKALGMFFLCVFWSCSDAAMHAIESYRFYLNGHGERWVLLSLLAANFAVLVVWLFNHRREHKETLARNKQTEDALTSPFAFAFYNVITFDYPFRHIKRVAFKLEDSPSFKAEFDRIGFIRSETIASEVWAWNMESQRKNLPISYAVVSEEATSGKNLAKIEKRLRKAPSYRKPAIKVYSGKLRDDKHVLHNIHYPPPYVSVTSEKLDT